MAGPGTTILRPTSSSSGALLPRSGRVSFPAITGFSRTMYCDELAVTNALTPKLASSARTGAKRSPRSSTMRSVFERLILVGPT